MAVQNVLEHIERKKNLIHLMNLIQKNDREQALEYIFTPEFQTKLQDVLDLKAQVAKMKDDYQNLQKSNTHLSNKLEEYQTELDEIKKSFLSTKGGSEDN
jgi:predicted nuclease with TOPRIM domain